MTLRLASRARRLWNYGAGLRKRFGLVAGTRLSYAMAQVDYRAAEGTPVPFRVPKWKTPVYLRAGTSDAEVFRQILLSGEFDFPLAARPLRILDGGANFGLASLVFHHRWPSAAIVGIELESGNFAAARRNCDPYPTIALRHAALWGESGSVAIANPGSDEHSFRASLDGQGSVRAYRIGELLDDLGWESVDLLKLDIEGAERHVLADSAAWLPRVRALLVELHDRFEPGCTAALHAALAGGDWDVRQRGEYTLATRRVG